MTPADQVNAVTSQALDDLLAAAGRFAIEEAARLWQSDIYDPRRNDTSAHAQASKHAIDEMLRAAGWTWEVPYLGDGQVEWCGIFAAACWRKAGLDAETAKVFWPSTYRLDRWAKYQPFDGPHPNHRPASGPFRKIAELDEHSQSLPWEPRAGDVLVIGPAGSGYGLHITLVESYDPDTHVFSTIEGNGVGLGPDRKQRQGVVRGARHLGGNTWHARRLIRPAPGDLKLA